jgi:hypothetical protein
MARMLGCEDRRVTQIHAQVTENFSLAGYSKALRDEAHEVHIWLIAYGI